MFGAAYGYVPPWYGRAALAVLGWLFLSGFGNPIPDSASALCPIFDRTAPCNFTWDGGLHRGTVTIIADSNVDEPDVLVPYAFVHATTVRFKSSRLDVAQIYQWLAGNNVALPIWLQQPPCIHPQCLDSRLVVPGYEGLMEEHLAKADVWRHLLHQTGDSQLQAALRRAYRSEGVPIIVKVKRNREWRPTWLTTGSGLAAVYEVPVLFRFALPGNQPGGESESP